MLNFKKINIVFIVICIALILLTQYYVLAFWWFLLLFFSWLFITALASFNIKWNYFLISKIKNNQVKDNVVAITFDDGPNQDFTPKFLALLKKYNVKATFFCIGKNITKNPTIFKNIINQGHEVGNHSYSHSKNYGFLSKTDLILDITKNQKLIKLHTNSSNIIFRPPFGVTNPNIAKALNNLNLTSIGWSIRTFDTVAKDANKIILKIKKNLTKGEVILMHDTNSLSLIVLEQLLLTLKQKNIQTVTISKLFNL